MHDRSLTDHWDVTELFQDVRLKPNEKSSSWCHRSRPCRAYARPTGRCIPSNGPTGGCSTTWLTATAGSRARPPGWRETTRSPGRRWPWWAQGTRGCRRSTARKSGRNLSPRLAAAVQLLTEQRRLELNHAGARQSQHPLGSAPAGQAGRPPPGLTTGSRGPTRRPANARPSRGRRRRTPAWERSSPANPDIYRATRTPRQHPAA